MKILYHHRTASRDGQAVHIAELIEAFRHAGHVVVVVGPAVTERQAFGGESGLVSALRRHLPKALYELLELGYSIVAYRRLKAAYRRHRPDVLYERFNLFLLSGAWLKRRFDLPFFVEVNAPLYQERLRFGGLALRPVARWSQEAVWRHADRVLPVTEVLADYVRAAGVPDDRIAVVPNGINRRQFLARDDPARVRSRLGLGDSLVLGFTGFVRDWHGLAAVVDWLAQEGRDADRRLLVVGDGPGRPALEDRARRLGVADRVIFTGLVDRAAVPEHVAAFDVALQPAVTGYASPLKIFEYMALGCAIVAPRSANILEVLSDGETALLFEPDDAASFRAAVDRVCGDTALRRRLGAAAQRLIDEKGYTWDGNARRIAALFEQALVRRQARPGRIGGARGPASDTSLGGPT